MDTTGYEELWVEKKKQKNKNLKPAMPKRTTYISCGLIGIFIWVCGVVIGVHGA